MHLSIGSVLVQYTTKNNCQLNVYATLYVLYIVVTVLKIICICLWIVSFGDVTAAKRNGCC